MACGMGHDSKDIFSVHNKTKVYEHILVLFVAGPTKCCLSFFLSTADFDFIN